MKNKLTALIAALAVSGLCAAAAIAASTIPVAVYSFESPNDLNSFQRLNGGAKCLKRASTTAGMALAVRDNSPFCAYRTSVIAASGDTTSSVEIQALASLDKKTSKTLQRKASLSVITRASATGRYELRIVPIKQKWVLLRDPDGPGAAARIAGGTLKAIKPRPNKATKLLLRTFAVSDTSATVLAQINGRNVFFNNDTAPDIPKGRYNGVGVGNKTGASAKGIVGNFDDITVRVPSPF